MTRLKGSLVTKRLFWDSLGILGFWRLAGESHGMQEWTIVDVQGFTR